MPIFEYNCANCKRNFETLVFSKEEEVRCPYCGNSSIDKQLSTFGVGVAHSALPCQNGTCGLSNSLAGCGEGACPGCMH